MKKFLCLIALSFLITTILVPFSSLADQSVLPTDNQGKKWRIGYVEGGPYSEYSDTFKATLRGLMELGWIEPTVLPDEHESETKSLWQWMAKNLKSQYILFVPDAHWTTDWEPVDRKTNRIKILKRLNQKQDIDLMMAMGTWAGQDLANSEHSVPTIVMAASDAVKAKIVPSAEDSGYGHLHARVDPTRYLRQIRLFHQYIGFKKLGIAYQNDLEGRTYAGLANVETAAKEAGFEIVPCFIPFIEQRPLGENYVDGVNCMKELSVKVDAIYIIQHTSQDLKNMPNLILPLLEHSIPTFAQAHSGYVKHGALMSISHAGFKYVGRFHAETIARVFNGKKPGEIPQIFEAPTRIAINMETAKKIGFEPPDDMLEMADEVYTEILQ